MTFPAASRRVVLGALLVVHLTILYAPSAGDAQLFPYVDKVVHLATFASVTWAGLWVGLRARWWVPLMAGHAVVSELVQHSLLPHRDGDVGDAVADLAGVLLGVLAASWLARASWRRDRSSTRGDAGRAPAGGDARAG
jgi:hypothetical protein